MLSEENDCEKSLGAILFRWNLVGYVHFFFKSGFITKRRAQNNKQNLSCEEWKKERFHFSGFLLLSFSDVLLSEKIGLPCAIAVLFYYKKLSMFMALNIFILHIVNHEAPKYASATQLLKSTWRGEKKLLFCRFFIDLSSDVIDIAPKAIKEQFQCNKTALFIFVALRFTLQSTFQ